MVLDRPTVLFSGGLDSAVALLEARAQHRAHPEMIGPPCAFTVDYGQRHSIEIIYAKRFCERYGIEHVFYRLPPIGSGLLTTTNQPIPKDRSSIEKRIEDCAPTFLPGRNLLLLTLAMMEGHSLGSHSLWVGCNQDDIFGYPDCTLAFLEAFQSLSLSCLPDSKMALVFAPNIQRSKAGVVRRGIELGLSLGDTWSCYDPQPARPEFVPCRSCDACVLRQKAVREVSKEE